MVSRALYEKLQEVALQPDRTISYREVAEIVDIPINWPAYVAQVGKILDGVGRIEHAARRPVLAAVVRGKNSKLPGKWFFELMQELGLCDASDNERCWRTEMNRVNIYWTQR